MIQNFFSTVSTFFAGDTVMSLYWGLAVGGSLFFILNLIFASIGGPDDSADGAEDVVDADIADFHFLSLRAVLAFISIFGWSGVLWGNHGFWGFLAAFVFGLIAMSLTAWVIWGMMHLQQSGNVKTEDIVGKTGTVYMKIPGGSVYGKVTVSVGGSTREITAIAADEIPQGTLVRVVEAVNESLYRVEKI